MPPRPRTAFIWTFFIGPQLFINWKIYRISQHLQERENLLTNTSTQDAIPLEYQLDNQLQARIDKLLQEWGEAINQRTWYQRWFTGGAPEPQELKDLMAEQAERCGYGKSRQDSPNED